MIWWLVAVVVAVWGIWWQMRRREYVERQKWWPCWAIPLLAAVTAILTWPPGIIFAKTAGLLVMPAGLVWLGLIGLFAVLRHRDEKGLANVVGALLALYTLAGNAWLGAGLLRLLESPWRGADPLAIERVDAALVLGGDSSDSPHGRVQIGSSGDRILVAAELQRRGLVGTLVASGAGIAGFKPLHDPARAAAEIWHAIGIPDSAILMSGAGRTTREEMAEFRELVVARGWTRVAVVTSAWHLPRALRAAADNGLKVVPVAADFRGRVPPPSMPNLIPAAPGFADVHAACWELIGRLAGR